MSRSRTDVSAKLGLGLVGPGQTIVPLMASLYYSCTDPYAVRMAFHVGTDEPVEWTLARDLLAAALHSRQGIGDVQAWPSADTLNIAMTSPFGQAQFEISARAITDFLHRTYEVVPMGEESGHLDFDAELTELLSEALSQPSVVKPEGAAAGPLGPAASVSAPPRAPQAPRPDLT